MHRTVPIPSLAEAGLNLQAVFSIEHLPQTLQQALTPLIPNTPSYPYLLLLAHAGTQLWTALQTAHIDLTDHTTNPIDTYTQETIATYFRQQHPQHQYHLLYPQYQATPLMPLGQLAGWSHPTPLGLGIHPHYGLWYAYRAALVTTAPLPLTSPNTAPSPCLTCHHKPCLTACPPKPPTPPTSIGKPAPPTASNPTLPAPPAAWPVSPAPTPLNTATHPPKSNTIINTH
ncbi:MAG TPA: hypothetical protein VLL52_17645 [Anaerolineae bacterium]|nr:hypothetical protein [Anaerolineae bacterium]